MGAQHKTTRAVHFEIAFIQALAPLIYESFLTCHRTEYYEKVFFSKGAITVNLRLHCITKLSKHFSDSSCF